MRIWIDFNKLREELDFQKVLDHYQVRLHGKGDQMVGPCPMPGHTGERKSDSFSANLGKKIFQCFSCHAKGNILDFAVLMDNRDPKSGEETRKTAIELARRFQLQHVGSERKSPRPPEVPPKHPPLPVSINAPLDFELRDLDYDHEYLPSRGFNREIIELFGLGVCSRGKFAGRLAIPIHNQQSELVGYAGRLVQEGDAPKYLFPGSHIHNGVNYEFKKSLLLYNAHRIEAPVDDLIVVEGFASVWWLTQHGYPDCVALMGSSMSEEQARLIESLLSQEGQVTLFLDGDSAGIKGGQMIKDGLGKRWKIRTVSVMAAQPTDLKPEALDLLLRTQETDQPEERAKAICELILKFPCLKRLRIQPEQWEAESFDRQSLKFSSGERLAAQFVLGVWNPQTKWECGRFDLMEAASRFDEDHRHVILEWLQNPWWP